MILLYIRLLNKNQTGKVVDVQSVNKAPHMHQEQKIPTSYLSFHHDNGISFQHEWLKQFCQTDIKVPDSNTKIQLQEKMRFMNGDSPAVEYEDGTQKGGHFACSGCEGDMRRAKDLRMRFGLCSSLSVQCDTCGMCEFLALENTICQIFAGKRHE
ncbi:hypothetical protein QZH41_017658 [Actinostola sp. cb2023]|nr:hypothetical protein QZH41_017658 [Actinostola sp. cb2023]